MTTHAIDPRDALILFADLQEGIVELSKTQPLPRLKKSVHALAKLAKILDLPILVSGVRNAIKQSGRKTLLISGVATELAVQLPAVTAADYGLRAFVVQDACGGTSERTEQAALTRIGHAGGSTVSVLTLAGELAGDFRTPAAQQAIGVIFEMAAG